MSIAENLLRVRAELADACERAGRSADSVRLMAVSKTHPAEAIHEAYTAGQRLFGENRVQEMQIKAPHLADLADLDLHLIGPLQNNKTGKAVELFHAVDTLDSAKTASRLNSAAEILGRVLSVLIEVKLSPEETKHGVAAEDLPALLEAIAALPHLRAAGFMTVPPLEGDAEAARPFFRHLRELRDRYASQYPSLIELSMGMSGDFAVAVEEGSTTVRIGTAIFGRRENL
ncbi:MAG: YggS family pyridoxal phosphate-dependent enzyme [Janthinobacterium lividum]